MLYKSLFAAVVLFVSIQANTSNACTTDGCNGWATGHLEVSAVSNEAVGATMYAFVSASSTTQSDDKKCLNPNSIIGSPAFEFAAPYGLNARGEETDMSMYKSAAMLQVLTTAQNSNQKVVIGYTWSDAKRACVIQTVGFGK